MKVLLTSHQFLPDYTSGTEILTYKVAKGLIGLGHSVSIFTAIPAKKSGKVTLRFDKYEYEGIEVSRYYHSFDAFGGQSNFMEMEYDSHPVARHFRQILEDGKPDIVHFFHLGRLSSSLIPECHDASIPAFYTPTDFWSICPTNQLRLPNGKICSGPNALSTNCAQHLATYAPSNTAKLFAKLPNCIASTIVGAAKLGIGHGISNFDTIRAIAHRKDVVIQRLNSVQAILYPSQIMGRELEKNGVERSILHYLPYGLDLNFEAPPRSEANDGRLRVGFIGTLSEHKGAHLLIEAVKSTSHLNIELLIYGNLQDYPDYGERLRKMVGNSPKIKLMGTFPNSQLGHVFSNLDILAVPSIWYENTPLVILSAQACRCPVICSNLGGMSESVKHELNGLVFSPGSVAEIASTLVRLHNDRVLLEKLAANSIPPTSIKDYVSKLVDLYDVAYTQREASK